MGDAPKSKGTIKNASPTTVTRNPSSWSVPFVRFGRLGSLDLAMFFPCGAAARLKQRLGWHIC
jgi:hypothetical protein